MASKRKLLMMITEQILLYGAEIWAESLKVKCRVAPLAAVQRTAMLRVISAYRTVSGSAARVIAGSIPIHILAEERKSLYDLKEEGEINSDDLLRLRERTLNKWQHDWDTDRKGRWTARLIPDIRYWIQRKHGDVGYYLTQVLSGHGYFQKYLYNVGKTGSPRCIYDDADEDTVEHTVFDCIRWVSQRGRLEDQVGHIDADNIVQKMVTTKANWSSISQYVEQILRTKKTEMDKRAESTIDLAP